MNSTILCATTSGALLGALWSRPLNVASSPLGSSSDTIDRETLTQQVDDLIRSVTSAAEGPLETDLVMSLIRLRDDITGRKSLGSGWESTLREMQADINHLVNGFFEARLRAIPEVSDYLDSL